MLDTREVINVHPVDGHFDFEYCRVKYRWNKETKRNWNLKKWKGVTVAEFNKVELALTKIGDIFIMGKLPPEIIIVTIKAIEMAHERYGWKCTEL
jgi:UDP-galactopyranose mutase